MVAGKNLVPRPCGGENGFADRSHEIASIRFICLGIAEALIAEDETFYPDEIETGGSSAP